MPEISADGRSTINETSIGHGYNLTLSYMYQSETNICM